MDMQATLESEVDAEGCHHILGIILCVTIGLATHTHNENLCRPKGVLIRILMSFGSAARKFRSRYEETLLEIRHAHENLAICVSSGRWQLERRVTDLPSTTTRLTCGTSKSA